MCFVKQFPQMCNSSADYRCILRGVYRATASYLLVELAYSKGPGNKLQSYMGIVLLNLIQTLHGPLLLIVDTVSILYF